MDWKIKIGALGVLLALLLIGAAMAINAAESLFNFFNPKKIFDTLKGELPTTKELNKAKKEAQKAAEKAGKLMEKEANKAKEKAKKEAQQLQEENKKAEKAAKAKVKQLCKTVKVSCK